MMIGIEEIGTYIPAKKISNYQRADHYGVDAQFIEKKLGIKHVARKAPSEKASDLALFALNNLLEKSPETSAKDIECLIFITQNPDFNLPHTSAVLHEKAGLAENCAAFDISLGCSGYVYGLSVIEAFMEKNQFKKGVLITADPYSDIINPGDRNTALLFGDAATATLISNKPMFRTLAFSYGTLGKLHKDLINKEGQLEMNGRGIFDFAARYIPKDVKRVLEINQIEISNVDRFLFHQASKFMVNTIARRLRIPTEKVAFDADDYGNTVSSSIPLLLEKEMSRKNSRTLVLSGFGVGLSWASCVIRKTQ